MKTLFITAGCGGNLPPTFAVANALTRRGVEIVFAGLEADSIGFPTASFDAALAVTPDRGGKGLRKGFAMAGLLAGPAATRTARTLVAAAQPDGTVVDCTLIAPLRGALAASRPVAVLFYTLGDYWAQPFDRGPAGRGLALLGMRQRPG
ncbi:hypothetical protein [Leucobacter sp. G161]|uniref:hypothetical protein n=1 Tax=Leucobacter sp. G161 TaxID=663704 RepID=UPI00073CA166|nr:hypothetical protein [Leucobacter sp. G161]KUF06737.1 hypothetical protein AUL38_12025 [Leucobacter sp. G161]